MAKKGMNIKYKSRKRERNKYDPTMNEKDTFKSGVKVFIGVGIFLGLMYLCVVGMEKLGVFMAGYTAPTKETKIDYEYINIGTVFNRPDKVYYVLFDDYSTNISYDMYVNTLMSDSKIPVYKVDMSKAENSKFASEIGNKKATRSNELKIHGITLIKMVNGRIKDYIEGSNNIETYLK